MRLWVIPTVYIVASVVAAFVLPRLEQAYLAGYAHDVAVGSALAFFSAVGSGMIALTGVVFAIAFIVMQFRSVAYSPRLVVLIGSDPALFHTLGVFAARRSSIRSRRWSGPTEAVPGRFRCSPRSWSRCCLSPACSPWSDWFRASATCKSTACFG